MRTIPRRRRAASGETSIVLAFVMLSVLVLGGLVLAVLAVRNLRAAHDVRASSEALYAADAALEFGLTHFQWAVPFDKGESPANICTVQANVPIAGQRGVFFDVIVTGDRTPAVVSDPDGTEDDGNCPTQDEVRNGARALCITAIGKARDGAVRRRVQYDTDSARCR